MQGFVQGADRGQTTLLPECVDDWVDEGNSIRAVDVYIHRHDGDVRFVPTAEVGQDQNRLLIQCRGPILRGCKRGVRNRNFCSQSAAQCHHLSIKLFCERINHAGTKPGFRLSEHAIRLTGAIVGDRKLPICS
jgi:hypothetical protein